MKLERLAAGLLWGGLLGIAAALPALGQDEARLQKFFGIMDSDGDGRISRPEFQTGKGAVFLAIDEDGSMTLTADEVRLSLEGFKLLAGDDGLVDGQEFVAADIASFEAIDANKDHQLDFAELRDHVAKYAG
jgi:Ca2+-binding EF-hand superfamily protein